MNTGKKGITKESQEERRDGFLYMFVRLGLNISSSHLADFPLFKFQAHKTAYAKKNSATEKLLLSSNQVS